MNLLACIIVCTTFIFSFTDGRNENQEENGDIISAIRSLTKKITALEKEVKVNEKEAKKERSKAEKEMKEAVKEGRVQSHAEINALVGNMTYGQTVAKEERNKVKRKLELLEKSIESEQVDAKKERSKVVKEMKEAVKEEQLQRHAQIKALVGNMTYGQAVAKEERNKVTTKLALMGKRMESVQADAKKERSKVAKEMKALGKRMESLVGKLLNKDKISQSMLPGGYDKVTAYDLQWQSLHMAAAAACRTATKSSGSGLYFHFVYPRKSNVLTCTQICANTSYKNCDATLTINGYVKKATDYDQKVGLFYNYGCDHKGYGSNEVTSNDDAIFSGVFTRFGFCCCRS